MWQPLPDQILIEQILQNDPAAFENLVACYQAQLRWHILRFVRDSETADDLLQETFLRVWTHADQWDGRGSLKAWLYRIATNMALNHLRTLKRHGITQPLDQQLVDDETPDLDNQTPAWLIDRDGEGPETLAEQREGYRLLKGLVEQLPEEKREAFLLAHEAEMDMRDIANRLGIPAGTVKSRLHYANKRLASLKLARPVSHPWLSDQLLTEVGLSEAIRQKFPVEIKALQAANQRLERVLTSHAPTSLVETAQTQLENRVRELEQALTTPAQNGSS